VNNQWILYSLKERMVYQLNMDLESYSEKYVKFMTAVRLNHHNVNISTITLICNLNKEKLDIPFFTERFNKQDVTIKVSKSNKEFEISKRGKIKKTFFNQVTLNYTDISKKSIKIFSNAKLQITGISSYWECNHVMTMVLRWLNEIFASECIEISHSYIGMINSNFSMNQKLDLPGLNNILNRNDKVMSIYNPESYPAINMKIVNDEHVEYTHAKSTISIFIFGTGNIVITGSKSMDDISKAYFFITNTIKCNPEIRRETHISVKNDKKVDHIIDGYPIRQYLSALKKYI